MPNDRSNSSPWLALLVGALIVAVGVIAYFVFVGRQPEPGPSRAVDVQLTLPKTPPLPDAPKLPDAPIPTPQ